MIDRKKFFDCIRSGPFDGKLTAGQVSGTATILDEWNQRQLPDLRCLADILGTAKWETDHTMQPIKEGGGLKYLKAKKYWPWYGRGYVQLTWQANYQKFRDRVLKLFGVDIVANADLAMRPDVAAFIMFEGMINGEFTGKKLADYFNVDKTDWIGARKIINGNDHAIDIAGISKQFYADLVAAAT